MRSFRAAVSGQEHIEIMEPEFRLYRIQIPDSATLNERLNARFLRLMDHPSTHRSHHFHGRFENIYLDRQRLPEIEPLIREVESAAAAILDYDRVLRTGFWFNRMESGDLTTLHSHDEDGELLSAVYYLQVPAESGNLVFHSGAASLRVTPQPGVLLLFPPDLPHEVETHRGIGTRLSVAFNTGPA